jgi:hypothetical protein
MARIRAILIALITALRRDLKTVGSFSGNNLFVVAIVFLFLGDPGVFGALFAFIGLLLFIPLSADPLRVLPRDRLAVWPLSTAGRRALRFLSPWLNPLTWLIVALAAWRRVSAGLSAVVAGVFLIGFVLPSFPPARKGAWRRLPGFPGPLNHLIRKNLRETLSRLLRTAALDCSRSGRARTCFGGRFLFRDFDISTGLLGRCHQHEPNSALRR